MTWPFFDSNILINALGDDHKGDVARQLLDRGGCIGVQTLNEFANVSRRKLRLDWSEIDGLSSALRQRMGSIPALTPALHIEALRLAQRYSFAFYDALIVAAALEAGCDTLYSEDMHAGLVVDGRLTVVNPFA